MVLANSYSWRKSVFPTFQKRRSALNLHSQSEFSVIELYLDITQTHAQIEYNQSSLTHPKSLLFTQQCLSDTSPLKIGNEKGIWAIQHIHSTDTVAPNRHSSHAIYTKQTPNRHPMDTQQTPNRHPTDTQQTPRHPTATP